MGALQYVDTPGYAALILRRTFSELAKADSLIPRSHEWLSRTDAVWNEQRKAWSFPSGATVEFGHVENENDKYNYQSAAYQYIAFDELSSFSEGMYDYIGFTRARRPKDSAIPIRTRAASNPGGSGHAWVKTRFIDARKRGVVFIPAKVADNPGLDVEEYVSTLSGLPEALRLQLLEGDWGAFEGMAFEDFERSLHLIEPFAIPEAFYRFESMDYGLNAPTAWLAYAVDHDGNLIVFDSYYRPGLPSETAPEILRRREDWGSRDAWGDPNSLAMRTGTRRKWGDPATVETEFADNGVAILRGNDNPRAGYTRLRELVKPDPERRFPDWHPRRGELGSPRIFIVGRRCPELVEQFQTAPLQPIDKKDGGEKVDPDWESRYGHALASARYGVLSRPGPSEVPPQIPDDPRAQLLAKVEADRDQQPRRKRFQLV